MSKDHGEVEMSSEATSQHVFMNVFTKLVDKPLCLD